VPRWSRMETPFLHRRVRQSNDGILTTRGRFFGGRPATAMGRVASRGNVTRGELQPVPDNKRVLVLVSPAGETRDTHVNVALNFLR